MVWSVACSRDGRSIASGSVDKTVILWDARTYTQLGYPLTGHTNDVYSVCFSPDSTLVASGSYDLSVRVWSIETCSLVCELKGHLRSVTAVVFSPDGRNVLSGSLDKIVRVWDVKESTSIDQLFAESLASGSCVSVSYVPNRNSIACGLGDGNIYIYDTCTGAAVGEPMRGHTDAVNALAVSSGGQWLVSRLDDFSL